PDIDTAMGFNARTATPAEYIEALLGYCAPNLFDDKTESPFNALTQAEDWSIATQFLLGIANIYDVSQNKVGPSANFGRILDGNAKLSQELAQTLAQAQQNNQCIEDAALSWMNAHATQLQLKKTFDTNDVTTIKETFATLYAEIKDAPHFDEFFVLDTKKQGSFFTHQGAICASFAEFACSPLFDLPQKLIDALSSARNNASTLSTEIPHQNPLVQGEVEINTTTMGNTELQALYERISTYKDAKLKEQLLAQLKQERPDFKPQIDAKQFLQHVAYGEQIEAEALLQKAPELAQALLKAHDIPFTDYSGRTFTCTAYEYAYWAKDTHMQRMLEKHIQQNEETRSLILTKAQTIEELVTPQAASGLFEHPRPRGLQYTTQDKEGKTITHCEAHFDLTPLKEALKHYLEEHDKNLDKSEADWDVLDKIWIEEVGRAQRDVPAHIAQEYCHPNRSFEDVTKDKALLDAQNPANLKRQLKFYNYETDKYDLWFCPGGYSIDSGLGLSFGILRAAMPCALGLRVGRECDVGVVMDFEAVKAIDEARTCDLRQSLSNLSQPPTAQSSQSHGI
ncbi:MAG: SidC, partial [bacterium]